MVKSDISPHWAVARALALASSWLGWQGLLLRSQTGTYSL